MIHSDRPADGQEQGPKRKYVGLTAAEARALESRVDGTIREAGTLESVQTLEIRSRVPGETSIISIVPEGTSVKKGDRLVQLDTSGITDEVRQQEIAAAKAKAALAAAESRLNAARGDAKNQSALAEAKLELAALNRERQINQIELEIKQAQRTRELSKERLETLMTMQARLKQLVENNNASAADLGPVQLQIAEAKAQSASAAEQLEFLNKYNRPFQEAALDVAILSAKTALETIRNSTETSVTAAQADLTAKKVALETELSRLKALETRIADCTIHAPRDGIVVYAMPAGRRTGTVIEEGAAIREGQPILTMPDMQRLQVSVRVHESRIDRVKKGQKVTIRIDAFPSRTFRGTVKSVSRVPLPGNWLRDAKEYPVIVSLNATDPALKLGLSCVAEIEASGEK
jgi:HlyD family secretion protein